MFELRPFAALSLLCCLVFAGACDPSLRTGDDDTSGDDDTVGDDDDATMGDDDTADDDDATMGDDDVGDDDTADDDDTVADDDDTVADDDDAGDDDAVGDDDTVGDDDVGDDDTTPGDDDDTTGGACGTIGQLCTVPSDCGSGQTCYEASGSSGPSGVCSLDRPICGGFVGAPCSDPQAPICMDLIGTDYGICVSSSEFDCVCNGPASADGLFLCGTVVG